MKKEYFDIYEMLFNEYSYDREFRHRRPFSSNEYDILNSIKKSIYNADKEKILRPDAKYFLIVNFHHLIVMPLFEKQQFYGIEFLNLQKDIDSDIITIIAETKKDIEKPEISGHQIMRTIDKLWKNLKTTKFELWG